jgi:hypothetical protein
LHSAKLTYRIDPKGEINHFGEAGQRSANDVPSERLHLGGVKLSTSEADVRPNNAARQPAGNI